MASEHPTTAGVSPPRRGAEQQVQHVVNAVGEGTANQRDGMRATLSGSVQRFPAAAPLLQDYLTLSAGRLPDKVALVCDGRRTTFSCLHKQVTALAATLAAHGVQRGDRVVIFADNTVETAVAFWAALTANAVATILSTQTKAQKLTYLLNDCAASTVISHTRYLGILESALHDCPSVRTLIVAGTEGGLAAPPDAVSWESALAQGRDQPPPERRNIDIDLAAIVYTSGSTGEPKGVMLTHRNMMAASTSISTYLQNIEDDVILAALPFSFDYGLYQMIMAWQRGARLVLERSFAYPTDVLRKVVSERVTGLPGVPTVFATLAAMKNLGEFDLSSIRYITNTAAALSLRQIRFLTELCPRARVYSMYGLTECKRCSYLPPEDLARKPTSVGIPIPNTECWIVDEADRRLGPNEVGQLVVRGANVMRGYWGKPDATARRLRPGPLPGEMVLYTGDLCRMDEEGYLYFVARMDDVIKCRGEKIAPTEVERALLDIPGVREAAVVGLPDEVQGHLVGAFVVLEDDSGLSDKSIQVECRKRLESRLVPTLVSVVPTLPKTSSGKTDKRAILQLHRQM
jgi:amino acid adenylation domain-containing protein